MPNKPSFPEYVTETTHLYPEQIIQVGGISIFLGVDDDSGVILREGGAEGTILAWFIGQDDEKVINHSFSYPKRAVGGLHVEILCKGTKCTLGLVGDIIPIPEPEPEPEPEE